MKNLGRLDLATPTRTEGKTMAGLPGTKARNENPAPAPLATPPAPPADQPVEKAKVEEDKFPTSLDFSDADKMPEAAELAAASNPFQDKVNELSRTGKASSWTGPTARMDWARDQIRRAANNIDKGADTRVVPARDQYGKPMQSTSVVWFNIRAKRARKSNKG